MRQEIISPLAAGIADLSVTAADVFTYTFATEGYLLCDQIYGRLEEAIAAGGFSTTAAIVTVQVGSTTVATFSTGVAPVAGAIGKEYLFTTSATNAPTGSFKFSAGDVLTVDCTAGVGGTLTGTMRVTLPVESNNG
jgi:hypothetical protein